MITLYLNKQSDELIVDDKILTFNNQELRILELLSDSSKNNVISNDFILSECWGDSHVSVNSVFVTINNIRKSLRNVGYQDVISNIRGKGYYLDGKYSIDVKTPLIGNQETRNTLSSAYANQAIKINFNRVITCIISNLFLVFLLYLTLKHIAFL
ncbi:winged helix-turn-helix domain-containing protein [Photobacterium minamisatsumaniensis]|uniref:winged helix-turn-helix domain-containing protein n=1 Tax=Photobacterium minamisatsumaniensis TaxID=2910233 RepID=UPI003D13642C